MGLQGFWFKHWKDEPSVYRDGKNTESIGLGPNQDPVTGLALSGDARCASRMWLSGSEMELEM